MSYLDRLRALEKAGTPEPTKPTEAPQEPTEAPSVGSVGSPPATFPPEDQGDVTECFEALPDPKAEARSLRVLALLEANPSARYAVIVNDGEPGPVVITVALRGIGTADLLVNREGYDGITLLEIVERHTGTIH